MKNSETTRSRTNSSIRKVTVEPGFCPNAAGSALFASGNTRVICAVHVSEEVPEHAQNKNTGWLTAEYTMLPYSTLRRTGREFRKRDGRSVEIQRLIGRSLRAGIDLSKIQGYALHVDCDVIQADGGTRTASITGGFLAMKLAVQSMLNRGLINENPLKTNIAAISVGMVDDEFLLDLDYSEDSRAQVDLNVVMNSDSELIEIQGTGENSTFTVDQLNSMLYMASGGISELIKFQNSY